MHADIIKREPLALFLRVEARNVVATVVANHAAQLRDARRRGLRHHTTRVEEAVRVDEGIDAVEQLRNPRAARVRSHPHEPERDDTRQRVVAPRRARRERAALRYGQVALVAFWKRLCIRLAAERVEVAESFLRFLFLLREGRECE